MPLRLSRGAIAAALVVSFAGVASDARAQEAINTPSATQPAEGAFYLRQRFQYVDLGGDPSPENRDIEKFISRTSLSYGLRGDMSLTLDVPVERRSSDTAADSETDAGVNDLALTFKHRPWQWDLNPVDSVRIAWFGGIEVPSGDSGFSSDSWDPYVGAAFTAILGRHGFNQALTYKFNNGGEPFNSRAGDGPDDALRYDSAYLFRVDPVVYAADTLAATYLTLELNGLYETNGDNEVLLGPGLLYEARSFALEISLGAPVVQSVRRRPETDLVVTIGFRILF